MLGYKLEKWTMPGEFEEYLAHYNQAKDLWMRLYAGIGQLFQKVEQARAAPGTLAQPQNMPWPTQNELRELYVTAEQKSAPLLAEFNRLPREVQQYAPKPGSEKHSA